MASSASSPPAVVYKILAAPPPVPLPLSLPLSALDAADGFLHLSTAAQVPATVARFFAAAEAVWLLRVPLAALRAKGDVRWEAAGSAGVFPHLYPRVAGEAIGRDEVEAVLCVERLAGSGWDAVDWAREL